MAARVGLLLRVLPLLLWGGLDAQRVGRELRREAEAFLEKYGYLSDQGPSRPSSKRFSNAIREFQWVSQLPVSGVLDPATLRQMMQPRCGVADTDSQMPWTERVSALFAGRRAKMRRKKRFARQALCNRRHNLISEYFHPFKKKPHPNKETVCNIPLPPSCWQH